MQYLTKDELIAILTKAREHSTRNWLMILVAFSHGLRASEIINLIPENFADGYITVKRLKHSNQTVQQLVSSDVDVLNEKKYLSEYLTGITGKLFPISRVMFWKIVQRHGEEAGIPKHKRHPHAFKHTCAKLALKGDMKIDELKQYLGHKSLNSTGKYLESDDEQASQAFAKAMGGTK